MPPGASFELRAACSRSWSALRETDVDTVLVAHNGPLSTAMMLLLEMPGSAVNRLWFEQGCWSCVELERAAGPTAVLQ